jgi:predicted ATP-dependent serine protease
MYDQKIGRKEILVRQWFAQHHESKVPVTKSVQDLYQGFLDAERESGLEFNISYGLFNGVVRKMRTELPGQIDITIQTQAVQPQILDIGEMSFPEFRRWKTGSLLDQMFSDHDEEGGILSGTANIVVGESGVGKSTVMLDILAKIKWAEPGAKVLYISSEMTRNDLFFYYQKNPAIAGVPTLLLTDYLHLRFDQMLEQVMRGDHDIILIDSYQDVVVKMTDVLGWKSNRAATWLTNLLIESADRLGKTVFAIQHMTKSGTYVGGTYLKHATTSMMEIRKDDWGRRYAKFSKNRRGGSQVDMRLYYQLAAGSVVWSDRLMDEQEAAVTPVATAQVEE